MFLVEIVFLLAVIAAAILLVQGTRKVPVQYAKRIVGNKQYGGARQYIPLKVNTAGVMPIIFAQGHHVYPHHHCRVQRDQRKFVLAIVHVDDGILV